MTIKSDMAADLWAFETRARREGFDTIAGVDEAGRGPLAGPVVSAAVVLAPDFAVPGVNDSKKVAPKRRAVLYDDIKREAIAVEVGIVEAAEIDRINILQAALRAMAIAVNRLDPRPDYLLIDGTFQIPSPIPQRALPKGDARSVSIAAASIIAKVTRDRLMQQYHVEYPRYGFDRHKGYPTKAHKEAVKRFGCCPIHRRTFKGVKEYTGTD